VSANNSGVTNEFADTESLIYESRSSNHITIITPIAPKVLLAVTGLIPQQEAAAQPNEADQDAPEDSSAPSSRRASSPAHSPSRNHAAPNGYLKPPKSLVEELGSISENLSFVLREEMGQMRWPDSA
jgi:hypothetical protein